jgi:hypothetical protein
MALVKPWKFRKASGMWMEKSLFKLNSPDNPNLQHFGKYFLRAGCWGYF